jgi:RNase P/RNase MRP subunit POP5
MPVRGTRRRYLAFKVQGGEGFDQSEVWSTAVSSLRYLYGVKGGAEADLRLIEYDAERGVGVLRCNHNYLTEVRASLALVTRIGDVEVSIQVLRVSGTVKTLREKMLLEF